MRENLRYQKIVHWVFAHTIMASSTSSAWQKKKLQCSSGSSFVFFMCTLLVVIAPLTVPQCEARRYDSLRHEERLDLEADIDVQQQVVRDLSVSQQSASNGDLPNAHFEVQEGPGQVHSTVRQLSLIRTTTTGSCSSMGLLSKKGRYILC